MPLLLFVSLVALLCCPPATAAGGAGGVGGAWVAPLAGPLTVRRPFDPPATTWGAGHRGVDLAAFAGAAVRAAGAGVVTFAGPLAGRGVVVVRHGALRTTYEPVSPLVEVGRVVTRGDPVARLDPGHPGPARSGEALLHWGLLRGDTYLDPLTLLPRGPSRLVPLPPGAPPGPPPGPPAAGAMQVRHDDGPPAPPPPASPPSPRRGAPATAGLLAVTAAAVAAGAAGAAPYRGGGGRRPRGGSIVRRRGPPEGG